MKPNLEMIEQVFFAAMNVGYAQEGDQPRTHLHEVPGSRLITFTHRDFHVLDQYGGTSRSNKSFGTTTISYKGEPVWVMQYGGWYKPEAISFLRHCLRLNYKENIFYGGRGPEHVAGKIAGKKVGYINRLFHGEFVNFSGEEEILDYHCLRLGHHWYRGMSLLEDGKSFHDCP